MINVVFWLLCGAMCGWIAYLATRTNEAVGQVGHLTFYMVLGTVGGLLGGVIGNNLGRENLQGLDPGAVVVSLMLAAIFVTAGGLFLTFFESTSSD